MNLSSLAVSSSGASELSIDFSGCKLLDHMSEASERKKQLLADMGMLANDRTGIPVTPAAVLDAARKCSRRLQYTNSTGVLY